MRCVIVSHTHWDREWYRTFQEFRARLVDTVDRVLEILAADPGYRFQLDGQSIVIEDYLAIRPERRAELEAACRAGRIAVGPWYVQPDSLIPCGETHVRNLLEGRRVAAQIGPCSTIAYTPDSFGHPAQLPQILRGFGLGPFVYWRGNGDEIADLPADYRWRAPDGSEIVACHLARGYFPAWGLPADVAAAVDRLRRLAEDLASFGRRGCVLLMNGIDHMLPDDNTREVAEALAKATGWTVERGLLDDYAPAADADLPVFAGELLGARVANLLPGVWSTRSHLKLANRRCESLLTGWVEPLACLARLQGTSHDEQPALRLAWRTLLENQAHDSICGCSQDRVHEHMETRYDEIEALAVETLLRLLERRAGLGTDRQLEVDPDGGEIGITVFNPSPHSRSDVVRLALEGFPAFGKRGVHPLLAANLGAEGFVLDGEPARLVPDQGARRPRLSPDAPVHDLEFIARDVPPLGFRRLRLARSAPHPDEIDTGREIAAGRVRVRATGDGCLDVQIGERRFEALAALEDLGDRGDSYDFDPVSGDPPEQVSLEIERRRHASGIQRLRVRRRWLVPACLAGDRGQRAAQRVPLALEIEARVAPGVERVDLQVRLDNAARDHRVRLLFPSGLPCERFAAATTFDIAQRSTAARDGSAWVHPAPTTFPQQGWVHANGLTVVAPGLVEAEVTPSGCIAVTLLRAVGWLSRPDLRTRHFEAGPSLQTPGAQCVGSLEATLHLLSGPDARAARDAELGLRAVAAGGPVKAEALLCVEPSEVLLSALKPAESGDGGVLRLLNPSDAAVTAQVKLGPGLAGRVTCIRPLALDESPAGEAFAPGPDGVRVELPPHALRSLWLGSGGAR